MFLPRVHLEKQQQKQGENLQGFSRDSGFSEPLQYISSWINIVVLLLQNKLLSVQSPLRVGAELFFKSCWQWSPCRRIFLAFDAVVEKCTCLHWDESLFYAVQGGSSNFVCGCDAQVWPFKWKLPSSTFLCYYFLCCTRWFKRLSLSRPLYNFAFSDRVARI